MHLTGKALRAFGAASGSIENSSFQKELASISYFFPHGDEHPPANVSDIYHNLFELLRSVFDVSQRCLREIEATMILSPCHYLDSNKSPILQIILYQLRTYQTKNLTEALFARSHMDIRYCLSEIMSSSMKGVEKL